MFLLRRHIVQLWHQARRELELLAGKLLRLCHRHLKYFQGSHADIDVLAPLQVEVTASLRVLTVSVLKHMPVTV